MNILEEAAAIIDGPRRASYGGVHESFERIAGMWTILLCHPVSPSDVAKCMLALKLCREANTPARDNRVDICGYAALLDQLATPLSLMSRDHPSLPGQGPPLT